MEPELRFCSGLTVVPSFVGNRDKLRYSVARQCFFGGINEHEQSLEPFLEPSVESSVGAPLIPSFSFVGTRSHHTFRSFS